MAKTAITYHFGCRLNQYETEGIKAGLEKRGILSTLDPTKADYIILNTCTVTNRSDQKSRSLIRRLHRINPNANIIVTGCYATTDPEKIIALEGIAQVVPNHSKAKIPELLTNKNTDKVDGKFGYCIRKVEGTSRAYVKIQDGCNKQCSYCKIPSARGKGVSRPWIKIINEIKELYSKGFKEFILTGVNIGWYRDENIRFNDLIEKILILSGDFILRISSIEPGDVNERFADFFSAETKMASFLHMPLQHGSKTILRMMRRGYTPTLFNRWLDSVRKIDKNIHVGTDLIVGFPGETPNDHYESLEFCKKMAFANIHIFPFSKRTGTPIETLLERKKVFSVHGAEIKKRITEVSELKKELYNSYKNQSKGKKVRGIVQNINKNVMEVMTENYLKLTLPLQKNIIKGDLITVAIP